MFVAGSHQRFGKGSINLHQRFGKASSSLQMACTPHYCVDYIHVHNSCVGVFPAERCDYQHVQGTLQDPLLQETQLITGTIIMVLRF